MKDYSLIIFVAVNIFFFDEATATATGLLTCRICRAARYLDDCPTSQVCSHDEYCYMEEKISISRNFEYTGGCRSKLACPSPTTGKKKSDVVACSQCCDRTDCNIGLCNLRTINSTNATHCRSCPDGVDDVRHCDNVVTCADNELCYSSMRTISHSNSHSVLHSTACRRKEDCTSLTMAVMEMKKIQALHNQTHNSKRDTHICDICCGWDLCNNIPCITLRDRLYTLYKFGRLNNETLNIQMHHP